MSTSVREPPPLPADIAGGDGAPGEIEPQGYRDHVHRAAVHAIRCVRRLDQVLALLDGEPLLPDDETRAAAQRRIAAAIIKRMGH